MRVAALAAAFVVSLAACDDAGSGDDHGARSTRQVGEGQEGGGTDESPAALSPAQLQSAVSGDSGIPEGWHGRGSDVYQGAEAVKYCGLDAETGCAGLTAMTMRTLENQTLEELQAGSDGRSMFIKMYSFDSSENATVTAKAIASAERHEASDPRRLKVTTAAEYTDAFCEELGLDEYSATAVMRTGAVVITVWGTDLKTTADIQPIARSRVERVLKIAAGRNPDA
ncbi:hypothetical protein ABZ930_07700 [Streptomyces sp. NPDC046716]|uniref:hypothetical protein n=1 Tax=Streptomyces sp. NPDC046716 TaxID=3157093 RepID=UPI0033FB5F3C